MVVKSNDKVQTIERVLATLTSSLTNCKICFRRCGVNRLEGKKGYCASSSQLLIYRYFPHYGEEPPISGTKGSGTIFFSRCSMSCVYCQNYKFSQEDRGKEVSSAELSNIMLELQEKGCHNINLVSPTHFVPGIVEALKFAYIKGLRIPIVYNTGGYDSLETIKLLEGIVDIYLPDMRYSLDSASRRYSNAPGYVENNRTIVKEMYRQVGKLKLVRGIAREGLIVRLLVLPNDISGTIDTLEFIAREIGKDVFLSVMSQYYPAYRATDYKELARRINPTEFSRVRKKLEELGLASGWLQPLDMNFSKEFAGENF